jgi:enoyl-CoA hydratase/carnithine racemase
MSVQFELQKTGEGSLAIATLDLEKALNSLSLSMIEQLHSKLKEWESNSQIYGVLIRGKGKAFCAGGDIRALYQGMKEKSPYCDEFFENEYRLDCSLYSYKKPLIVWAHGITMGGGMGIMQGARYRIVTDSTRMAMPEITIGLVPDVGANYFLRKAAENRGLFLGLSGARIKAADALLLKLADFWLNDSDQETLLETLKNSSIKNQSEFEHNLLNFFKANSKKNENTEFTSHKNFIDLFLKNTNAVQLMKWASEYIPQNDWEKIILSNVQKACPTSLGLIYTIWEKGKSWSIAESFYQEWFVAAQSTRMGDFQEGVRALLIDKDNNPQWNPKTVQDLKEAHIEAHFKSPLENSKNPLKDLLGDSRL